MKASRAVIDTNVLISALLSPPGTASRVTRFFIRRGRILFSRETFAEFETRLWHPKFDSYISLEERKSFLHDLGGIAVWIDISGRAGFSRDSDDDKFVETAINGRAHVLISGDRDLLVLKTIDGIPVLSPADALALIEA